MLEGEYGAWREMLENIRQHGHADLTHTLNYLTLPDWPLRLIPLDEAGGQLDVDRFYRYNQTLQEFFDETAGVDTRFRNEGEAMARAKRLSSLDASFLYWEKPHQRMHVGCAPR